MNGERIEHEHEHDLREPENPNSELLTLAGPAPNDMLPASLDFHPTATLLTVAVLAGGSLWGLWILFVSHLFLLFCTLVPTLRQFGPVITKYSTPARTVWLTIDDGPDPQTTPQVLALLEKFGARATFFLIQIHHSEPSRTSRRPRPLLPKGLESIAN